MKNENKHVPTEIPPTGDMAVIGEEGQSTLVSMQVLQGIYNEITGKSEELTKGYNADFQLTFQDLEQLHTKISQLYEQYSIPTHNESVTVYYYKDTRETFSSFDRFRLFNKSSLSCVESVLMKYNFLIILPKTKKPQNYTISIRLASKITIAKKMEEDIPGTLRFIRVMGSQTARVTVNYVDYLVARNFIDAIDGWIQGLPKNETNSILKLLTKHSHYFPEIAKYSLGILAFYLALIIVPKYLPPNVQDLNVLATVIVSTLGAMFMMFSLGNFLGSLTEDALDEYFPVTYIALTRGDELQIGRAGKKNFWKGMKAIAGVIGTLLLGIIASVIANNISP